MARRNTLQVARDRAEVARLRLEDALTFREIAEATGRVVSAVYRDYQAVLKDFQEREMEYSANLRATAVMRVERILRHLMPKVKKGDIGAINTYLRAQEQLNRLLGTEAPQRIETVGTVGLVVEFRDPERLEEPDGEIVRPLPDPDDVNPPMLPPPKDDEPMDVAP